MKWCCSMFETVFSAAGERGFSIFVNTRKFGEARFVLQHRAVACDTQPPTLNASIPVALVSDVCIRYCPWCGVDLPARYGMYIALLDRSHLSIPADP